MFFPSSVISLVCFQARHPGEVLSTLIKPIGFLSSVSFGVLYGGTFERSVYHTDNIHIVSLKCEFTGVFQARSSQISV